MFQPFAESDVEKGVGGIGYLTADVSATAE